MQSGDPQLQGHDMKKKYILKKTPHQSQCSLSLFMPLDGRQWDFESYFQ
jgi:hypothetical protein